MLVEVSCGGLGFAFRGCAFWGLGFRSFGYNVSFKVVRLRGTGVYVRGICALPWLSRSESKERALARRIL